MANEAKAIQKKAKEFNEENISYHRNKEFVFFLLNRGNFTCNDIDLTLTTTLEKEFRIRHEKMIKKPYMPPVSHFSRKNVRIRYTTEKKSQLHNDDEKKYPFEYDDLIIDRPFIQASLEYLPIRDKIFDFVNSSQVVEHTENPYKSVKELRRIGKSGQIACPSYINENIFLGHDFHNYASIVISNNIYFLKASHPKIGRYLHKLIKEKLLFRILISGSNNLFGWLIVRYYWGEGLKIHNYIRKKNSKYPKLVNIIIKLSALIQYSINYKIYQLKIKEILLLRKDLSRI